MKPGGLRRLQKSLKKHWKRYRKELKRCQANCSEKAIHAMRVETRRLLSTVELLGSFVPARCAGKLSRGLKQRLDIFDDLRDTQVQLLQVGKMCRAFPAARAFRDHLLKRELRLAKKTRKRIKAVTTGSLGELIEACRKKVEAQCEVLPAKTASAQLVRAVERAFTRTRQLRSRIDPRDTKTIHCTRVAFKKFRYMVEELAEYLPGANDTVLAEMRHYQAMMGDIQDAEVLLSALDKFLARKEIRRKPGRQLREELARRRLWLIRVYLDAADQLTDFWPPEKR
ncbi:MAG: hypothetical protein QOJ40_2100 [Verrucomicrobiota bacterium]